MGGVETRDVMINRRFADTYAGGANLIGRHLVIAQNDPVPWTIVGMVGDIAEDAPDAPAAPYVYVCMPMGSWPDPEYVVRTAGSPAALAGTVRDIVQRLDPSRAVFGMQPLATVMAATLEQPRLNAASLSAFAAAALALVAVGLYALLALSVTERRRELGVRLALGATPRGLMRTIVGEAVRLLAFGLAVGLLLLAASGRLLQSIVFGVTPHDPLALGAGVLVLVLVAMTAAAIPLRRAANTDPIQALR
jgi:predicted lysophospholipase L1 biosynthesis ABC-type transport system permease subunit